MCDGRLENHGVANAACTWLLSGREYTRRQVYPNDNYHTIICLASINIV